MLRTENSEDSSDAEAEKSQSKRGPFPTGDSPVCYMCFDGEEDSDNPLITPCKCIGDTKYVHVECLRKWHTAEADNQICFLSSVDATCSVCKSTFKSDFKLKDGRHVELFKSSVRLYHSTQIKPMRRSWKNTLCVLKMVMIGRG